MRLSGFLDLPAGMAIEFAAGIAAARSFWETPIKVSRVDPRKPENRVGPPPATKIRVTYSEEERVRTLPSGKKARDPGWIDAGWSGDPRAELVGQIVHGNLGQRCRLYQLNEHATEDEDGYRRLWWIDVLPEESPVAPPAEPTPPTPPSPPAQPATDPAGGYRRYQPNEGPRPGEEPF